MPISPYCLIVCSCGLHTPPKFLSSDHWDKEGPDNPFSSFCCYFFICISFITVFINFSFFQLDPTFQTISTSPPQFPNPLVLEKVLDFFSRNILLLTSESAHSLARLFLKSTLLKMKFIIYYDIL